MSENVFWSTATSSSTVTIRVGDTVTWENRGEDRHNAEAEDGTWSSGNLRKGESYSRRFDAAGEFRYVCTLHLVEEMTGRVVVLPAAGAATPTATLKHLFVPHAPR